jgi:hypothetical protein
MSKRHFAGLVFILAFAVGVQAVRAEQAPQRWERLSRIRPGERVAVTTAEGERAAVFVTADSSSVVIADVSRVSEESVRKGIAAEVRNAPTALSPGELDANGVRVPVVRVPRDQVQRVSRLSQRVSGPLVTVAVAAAVVASFQLGQRFALRQPLAAFGLTVGLPVAAALGVYSATKRPFKEDLYLAPPPSVVDDADWQAVQSALPPSLRQGRRRP